MEESPPAMVNPSNFMREAMETLERLRKQVDIAIGLINWETGDYTLEQTFRIGDFIILDTTGFESLDLASGEHKPIL